MEGIGGVLASDNCDDDVEITVEIEEVNSGVCENAFTIIRTWTATENCGHVDTAEQRIEVGDNTAPVLSDVPADITVECDEVPTSSGADAVSVTDNCDTDVDVTFEETQENSVDCENAFTIIRTWTATDNCGNVDTAE